MEKEIELELKAMQIEINELREEIALLQEENIRLSNAIKSTEILALQAYNQALWKK